MEEAVPDHILNAVDLSSFAKDSDLARGKELASELAHLDAEIKTLEKLVEKKKERRQELKMREIPKFFDEVLKTDHLGVPDANVDIVVEPYYHANIKSDWPEEQRMKGFDWLEKNDHGEIVAVIVSAKFSRGELKLAREMESLIRTSKFGNSHPPTLEMSTPWNTLTAAVKNMVEKGEKVPLELLGATVGRAATIKKRKK